MFQTGVLPVGRGSPRVHEDEDVVGADAQDDEDGEDVEDAEVLVLEDEAVDEVGYEEAAEDAEDSEAGDEERPRHEQHEQEDEEQGAHRQHHVTSHLKTSNSQRSVNSKHVVNLVNSERVVNSVNKRIKSKDPTDTFMSLTT